MASYIGASAEQEDADPILMAFAAEAAKGDPASPEARELVLRWQAHLVKFSRSCDEEKLRRRGPVQLGQPLCRGSGQLRPRHGPLHGRGHRGLFGNPVNAVAHRCKTASAPAGGGSFCPSGPRFSGLRAVDKPAPETHNKAINTPKIGCPAST